VPRLALAGSNCPVIFMTAIGDDATRKEAMEAGCIAYLKKALCAASLAGRTWESGDLTRAVRPERFNLMESALVYFRCCFHYYFWGRHAGYGPSPRLA
jgi:CheY-like chemotaxis protein